MQRPLLSWTTDSWNHCLRCSKLSDYHSLAHRQTKNGGCSGTLSMAIELHVGVQQIAATYARSKNHRWLTHWKIQCQDSNNKIDSDLHVRVLVACTVS